PGGPNQFTGSQSTIYLYDRITNHVSTIGTGGAPHISGDGTVVVREDGSQGGNVIHISDRFGNSLGDISATDPNFVPSPTSDHFGAPISVYNPDVSGDGRYVSFWSTSAHIVLPNGTYDTGNAAGTAQVYVYDRVAGTAKLISTSVSGNGTPGNGNSGALTLGN